MNVLIIDTSVWIEFFRGKTYPDLELALQEARVVLPPIVAAELLSGTRSHAEEKQLIEFLNELKLHEVDFDHWVHVGRLRRDLARKGLNISIPDTHVAQCTLELDGYLMTLDAVFKKIANTHPALKMS